MLDYYRVDGSATLALLAVAAGPLVEQLVLSADGVALGLLGALAPEPLLGNEFLPLRLRPALSFGREPLWRNIFAGDLDPAVLSSSLMTPFVDPEGRIAAVGSDGTSKWELRRIGPGIAWCVDVKGVYCRSLMDSLRNALRFNGLIPVTIELLG